MKSLLHVFIVIIFLFITILLTNHIWSGNYSHCLGCHGNKTLIKKDVGGRSVSLFISESEFRTSVHGSLSCLDCHVHIKRDAHPEKGKKTDHKKVDCGSCHSNEQEEYRWSVHAKSILREPNRAMDCYDCHGSHYILSKENPKSATYFLNIEATCERCHGDKEFVREHRLVKGPSPGELLKESVHGESGKVTCTSCHGSHNLRSINDPQSFIFRSNIPKTCGRCHPEISEEFNESVHGLLVARGRTKAPTCTTCHGIHSIKAKIDPDSPVHIRRIAITTCPQCHASERISREFRFTTLPVKSYYESFHGLSYRGGDTYSAHCASCHGVHDIRPSWDPKSRVHKDNLQKTCGGCHPRASEDFARGKIHTVPSIRGEEFGERIVGWVRIFYIVLIIVVVGGMLFFNFTDWLRKTIDRMPR